MQAGNDDRHAVSRPNCKTRYAWETVLERAPPAVAAQSAQAPACAFLDRWRLQVAPRAGPSQEMIRRVRSRAAIRTRVDTSCLGLSEATRVTAASQFACTMGARRRQYDIVWIYQTPAPAGNSRGSLAAAVVGGGTGAPSNPLRARHTRCSPTKERACVHARSTQAFTCSRRCRTHAGECWAAECVQGLHGGNMLRLLAQVG